MANNIDAIINNIITIADDCLHNLGEFFWLNDDICFMVEPKNGMFLVVAYNDMHREKAFVMLGNDYEETLSITTQSMVALLDMII